MYAKLLVEPWCRICRKPAGSAHHIVPRRHVDDRPEVVVPLCGNGTMGCHGDVEHGNEEKRRKLGEKLKKNEMAAVLHDLGDRAGRAHLNRRYYIAYDDPRYP